MSSYTDPAALPAFKDEIAVIGTLEGAVCPSLFFKGLFHVLNMAASSLTVQCSFSCSTLQTLLYSFRHCRWSFWQSAVSFHGPQTTSRDIFVALLPERSSIFLLKMTRPWLSGSACIFFMSANRSLEKGHLSIRCFRDRRFLQYLAFLQDFWLSIEQLLEFSSRLGFMHRPGVVTDAAVFLELSLRPVLGSSSFGAVDVDACALFNWQSVSAYLSTW